MKLVTGEILHVIHPGMHNTDSGPDFFNARIKVGSTEWAGNVEIHVHASDWYKHHHEKDPAYQKVVLHVVFKNDKIVLTDQQQRIPTLELNAYIDEKKYSQYANLLASRSWVPCES